MYHSISVIPPGATATAAPWRVRGLGHSLNITCIIILYDIPYVIITNRYAFLYVQHNLIQNSVYRILYIYIYNI